MVSNSEESVWLGLIIVNPHRRTSADLRSNAGLRKGLTGGDGLGSRMRSSQQQLRYVCLKKLGGCK
jgi:hypothetical protein